MHGKRSWPTCIHFVSTNQDTLSFVHILRSKIQEKSIILVYHLALRFDALYDTYIKVVYITGPCKKKNRPAKGRHQRAAAKIRNYIDLDHILFLLDFVKLQCFQC